MEKRKRITHISEVVIFVLVVIVLGILSILKLVRYYVNDELDYNNWTVKMGSKFETDVAASFFEKFQFVNMNGAMRNLLRQPEMNNVIKLNNGYLTTLCPYLTDEQLHGIADALIRMDDYLASKDIPFLYLTTPRTPSKFDPQLPAGIEHYANDYSDRLVEMLQEGGVECIDLRQTLHDEGINEYDMLFRTDHHWTPKGGFYAFGKINDWLTEKLDCDVDPRVTDLSNYTVTTYKHWHLGSRGQRTGIYYGGVDDFDLIVPNFETSLASNGAEGTYQDLVINMRLLQSRDPIPKSVYDDVYMNSQIAFHNDLAWNDKKILVYTDSFGTAVLPFMDISYQDVDPYNVTRSPIQDIIQDIESDQPDAVVMFFYWGNELNPNWFNGYVFP